HPPGRADMASAARQRALVFGIRPSRRIAWLAAPAAALAAAALLIVVQRPEETRVKGGDAALLVYRSHGDEPELLSSGASARAGDVLQIAYIRSAPVYGAIVSLDGAGSVTLHLPEQGDDA